MASSMQPRPAPAGGVDTAPLDLPKQVAFYFSEGNLAKDRYLVSQMAPDGSVDVNVIAKFRRVQGCNLEELVAAAESVSELEVIKGSPTRIRPRFIDSLMKRQVRGMCVIRELPPNTSHNDLTRLLGPPADSASALRVDPLDSSVWMAGFPSYLAAERFTASVRERNVQINDRPIPIQTLNTEPLYFALGFHPVAPIPVAPFAAGPWGGRGRGLGGRGLGPGVPMLNASAPPWGGSQVGVSAAGARPTSVGLSAPVAAPNTAAPFVAAPSNTIEAAAAAGAAAAAAAAGVAPTGAGGATGGEGASATAAAAGGRGGSGGAGGAPAGGRGGRGERRKGGRETRREANAGGRSGRGAAPVPAPTVAEFPPLPRASEYGAPKRAFGGRVYEPERLLAACLQLSRKCGSTPPAMPESLAALKGAAAAAVVQQAQPVEAALAAGAPDPKMSASAPSPLDTPEAADRWVASATPTASTPAVPFAARSFGDVLAASPTAAVPSSMVFAFPNPPSSTATSSSSSAPPASPSTAGLMRGGALANSGMASASGTSASPPAGVGADAMPSRSSISSSAAANSAAAAAAAAAATQRRSFAQAAIAARDVQAPSTGMVLSRGQPHPTGTPHRAAVDVLSGKSVGDAPPPVRGGGKRGAGGEKAVTAGASRRGRGKGDGEAAGRKKDGDSARAKASGATSAARSGRGGREGKAAGTEGAAKKAAKPATSAAPSTTAAGAVSGGDTSATASPVVLRNDGGRGSPAGSAAKRWADIAASPSSQGEVSPTA